MRIELTGKVKLKNRLVNSISILDDSIYYSSSLMNSISKLNLSTLDDEVVVGEGCGYGRYKFREPVHVKAIKEGEKVCLLVSDWHNHRLLKYSNNKYITELGFFASTSSKIKNIAKFIKGMSVSGSYIETHFKPNSVKHNVRTSFFHNAAYFFSSSFRLTSKRFFNINKPNGVSLYKNGFIFTQKNRNVLSFVDEKLNPIKEFTPPESGRLANVTPCEDGVIFCIESIGVVYRLNNLGTFSKILLKPSSVNFKPFCACVIEEDLLAVISMSNLHIFEISSGLEKACYSVDGELHGLDVSNNNIYISDRENSEIYILRLNND
ncbi:hypothetical protein R0K04_16045 [Pseudoalteromonas sp. SIMBA_153]|jgi:hypothetical protein|uniref:hypothetical protein n=2 Tax=Bacteria TaxID=2 RepID=UPI0020C0065A|nr:hypothetical protein [Pseudoalteromonas sp. 2CM39R]MCK8126389.1 hypothetical protein [Pseudoalteromonas sp. 2CM39R]